MARTRSRKTPTNRAPRASRSKTVKEQTPTLRGGVPVDSVVAEYDFPKKLRNLLASLDDDMLYPDSEMRQAVACPCRAWTEIKRRDEFSQNKLICPSKPTLWGTAKAVARARQVIDMV